jgi:hypothetical protein
MLEIIAQRQHLRKGERVFRATGAGKRSRAAKILTLIFNFRIWPKRSLTDAGESAFARPGEGFELQLIRDRKTDRILGGRALAHEGSEVMMEISLAIRHRMTARELAAMFHPYLTLGEAVKLAALLFGKDVNKLSCCAT